MIKESDIQPVIIGTDLNAYGVARAFHSAYGITSKVFGRKKLLMVDHSKICDVTEVENFGDDDTMVEALIDYSKNHPGKKHVLFAASEQYVFRILNNHDRLRAYYFIPYSEPELGMELSNKTNFYNYCEQFGLDYPHSERVNSDTFKNYKTSVNFPLILKPSESNDYFYMDFEGKEKAFIVEKEETLHNLLEKIYAQGYAHDMLIQEYIEGDVSNEFVMNTYSDSNGKVKLMSLGRIVIEDPQPDMRGNYIAIINPEESEAVEKLYKNVKGFLENINFKGLANFDFKYDTKEQKFKAFEINMRQGRSSYFSIMAGANFAVPIVNELTGKSSDSDVLIGREEFAWINCSKKTFYAFMEKQDKHLYEKVKAIENTDNSLAYGKDGSIKRKLKIRKYFKLYDDRLSPFIK